MLCLWSDNSITSACCYLRQSDSRHILDSDPGTDSDSQFSFENQNFDSGFWSRIVIQDTDPDTKFMFNKDSKLKLRIQIRDGILRFIVDDNDNNEAMKSYYQNTTRRNITQSGIEES